MYAIVRSLRDFIREQEEARKRKLAVRQQSQQFRDWWKPKHTTDPRDWLGGKTPAQVNPLGQLMRQAQLRQPELRPSRALPTLKRNVLEEMARAFAPEPSVLEQQRVAFQGRNPEQARIQQGGQRAREFFNVFNTPERQRLVRDFAQQQQAYRPPPSSVNGMPVPVPPTPLQQLQNRMQISRNAEQGFRPSFLPGAPTNPFTALIQSPLQNTAGMQALGRVPVAGPALRDVAGGIASPLGMLTLPLAPAGVTARGIGGAVAGGTAANALGAPPWLRGIAEGVGAIVPDAALALRGLTRPRPAVVPRTLPPRPSQLPGISRPTAPSLGGAAQAREAPQFGTRPPPEFGSMRPEFRGEQGGLQSRMFSPEETGQVGQIGLEDVVARKASAHLRDIEEELSIQREILADPATRGTRGLTAETRIRIAALEEQRKIVQEIEGLAPDEAARRLAIEEGGLTSAQGMRLAGQESMAAGRGWRREAQTGQLFKARNKPTRMGHMTSDDIRARLSAIDDVRIRLDLDPVPMDERGRPLAIGGGNPVQRLRELIAEAKPALAETAELRAAERSRRAGAIRGALAEPGASPEQKLAGVGHAMRGKMPTADFDPVRGLLDPGQESDLKRVLTDYYAQHPQHATSTQATADALDKILDGVLPNNSELKLLENVYGAELTRALLGHDKFNAWREVGAAFSLWRSLLTGGEQSILLRQGGPVALNPFNAPKTARAALRGLKAGLGDGLADDVMQTLQADPAWERLSSAADAQGIRLFTDPKSVADVLGHEEQLAGLERSIIGRWSKSTPVLGHYLRFSDRMASATMNSLRLDIGKKYLALADAAVAGVPEAKQAATRAAGQEFAAKATATLTGRAKLPLPNDAAKLISQSLFSAQMQAARVKTPLLLSKLVSGDAAERAVARSVALDLAGFIGFGTSILAAAKLSGAADVELNPLSTDWGKLKIGPTRIDPWAGFQQYAKFVTTMATGKRKTSAGEIVDISRFTDVLQPFITNKLAPGPSLAVDVLRGHNALGEPVELTGETVKREGLNRFMQLMTQDVIDAVRYQHSWKGSLVAPLVWFGVGAQSYETTADRLKAAFAVRGIPYDPDTAYTIAASDPELKALLPRTESQEQLAQTAEELAAPLRQFADQIRAGDADAGQNFAEAYSNFKTGMFGATTQEYQDREFSPEPKLIQDFYDISPQDFADEAGTVDFGAYEQARDAALAKLPTEFQQAIENRLRLPEDLQDIEQQFLAAKAVREQLYDISPYRGLSPDEYRQAQQLRGRATQIKDEQALSRGRRPTSDKAIVQAGRELGIAGRPLYYARHWQPEERRNRAYTDFLVQHWQDLQLFYPGLLSADYLAKPLRRAGYRG